MFQFKQFKIHDGKSAMKIGTDGTLLGCWSDVGKAETILDIGSGTGVIAIIAAQNNKEAKIKALEIDKLASEDAQLNIDSCPWSDRIEVQNISLQNYTSNQKYDAIISNPPFFERSMKALGIARNTARHTDTLHYTDIFRFCKSNLSEKGNLSMILPVENAKKAVNESGEYGLYPKRICEVKPIPKKEPHRWLVEWSFDSQIKTEYTKLTIETGVKRHEYTDEYKRLGKAFYLYF